MIPWINSNPAHLCCLCCRYVSGTAMLCVVFFVVHRSTFLEATTWYPSALIRLYRTFLPFTGNFDNTVLLGFRIIVFAVRQITVSIETPTQFKLVFTSHLHAEYTCPSRECLGQKQIQNGGYQTYGGGLNFIEWLVWI